MEKISRGDQELKFYNKLVRYKIPQVIEDVVKNAR